MTVLSSPSELVALSWLALHMWELGDGSFPSQLTEDGKGFSRISLIDTVWYTNLGADPGCPARSPLIRPCILSSAKIHLVSQEHMQWRACEERLS